MIAVSQAVLNKINNPLQLPSNQGDPQLSVYLEADNVSVDVGQFVKSGTISSRYDDYIYNVSLTFLRAAAGQGIGGIENPDLPFYPGAKCNIFVKFGSGSGNIPIAFFHIAEVSWDGDGETFTVSGTNNIGSLLTQCCMGDTLELTGVSHEVGAAIMDIAGVDNYVITYGEYEWTYTYKPNDTCLAALEQMYPIFPKKGDTPGFGILEKPDGTVVFGYWVDRQEELPVGSYAFDAYHDCWTVSTRKTLDKCYSKVIATGKAADGVDLESVTVDITNYNTWVIPENKIYFADFNGYTMQELLQDWAETVALELQFQGITDDITGPFRPQLTVGDIGYMTIGNVGRQGVITSITHHIGMDGFSTDFSMDSGGVYSAASGWSSNMKANGYNRRQKLADTIKEIADEATNKALSMNDTVSVQNKFVEPEEGEESEEPEEADILYERNIMTIVYDGRNWQDLLPSNSQEEEGGSNGSQD